MLDGLGRKVGRIGLERLGRKVGGIGLERLRLDRRRGLELGGVGDRLPSALGALRRPLGPRPGALFGRALALVVSAAPEQRAHACASSQPSSRTAAARASSAASPGTRAASVVVKRSS